MFTRLSFWIALAGIVGAVSLVLRLKKADVPTPPPSEAPRSPFTNTIGARGLIEGVDENIRIAPSAPGLVVKVLVKVGDNVKQGDPLIEQDQRDAAALIAQNEASLAAMQAQIKEADIALADREDQWRRIEKLSTNAVASEDEKQRSRFGVEAARSKVERMRAELAASTAQLERAKVQRDLLTVRAPRPGRVLQINIRPGEYAAGMSGEPMLILGQVEQLQLRADVDEDNAHRIRPEMPARAFLKGQRDTEIPLTFVRIEPYIVPKKSLTGLSTERVDTRVLQIIYRFDRPTVPVYVGQQMDVFLDASKAN